MKFILFIFIASWDLGQGSKYCELQRTDSKQTRIMDRLTHKRSFSSRQERKTEQFKKRMKKSRKKDDVTIISSDDNSDESNQQLESEFSKEVHQQMLIEIIRKSNKREILKEFIISDVVLNQYGIYYQTYSNGHMNIEGLQDMIRYDELVTEQEALLIKKKVPSISKISSIRMEYIMGADRIRDTTTAYYGPNNLNSYYPCFEVDDSNQDQIWKICDISSTETLGGNILQFRNSLITKVIQNVQLKNDVRYVNGIVVLEEDGGRDVVRDDLGDWDYIDQDKWNKNCMDKQLLQSPINIVDQQIVIATSQIRVFSYYQGDGNTRSVKGLNEYFLIGSFGFNRYQNNFEKEDSIYCGWRIEFKFKSEHQIDGNQYPMELLVYHKKLDDIEGISNDINYFQNQCEIDTDKTIKQYISQSQSSLSSEQDRRLDAKQERKIVGDNTDLIISYLIDVQKGVQQYEGIFWEGLNKVQFDYDTNIQSKQDHFKIERLVFEDIKDNKNDKMLANLEGLVDEGLSANFKNSFYYYTGTMSQPLCFDRVKRIVMLKNVTIDIKTYDYLQQQVFKGFGFNENSRQIQNTDNDIRRYQVYKHYDISDKRFCQSKSLLTSFSQNGVVQKLSLNRRIDFQKMIDQLEVKKLQYMSIAKRLQYRQEQEQEQRQKEEQTKQSQFTHLATVSTQIQQIHRMSKKQAQRIFNDKNLVAGQVQSLRRRGGDDQTQVDLMYLGDIRQKESEAAVKDSRLYNAYSQIDNNDQEARRNRDYLKVARKTDNDYFEFKADGNEI